MPRGKHLFISLKQKQPSSSGYILAEMVALVLVVLFYSVRHWNGYILAEMVALVLVVLFTLSGIGVVTY